MEISPNAMKNRLSHDAAAYSDFADVRSAAAAGGAAPHSANNVQIRTRCVRKPLPASAMFLCLLTDVSARHRP